MQTNHSNLSNNSTCDASQYSSSSELRKSGIKTSSVVYTHYQENSSTSGSTYSQTTSCYSSSTSPSTARVLSTVQLNLSQEILKESSSYLKVKLSEAPLKITLGYRSFPAMSEEEANSLSNNFVIEAKLDKYWKIAKKPLSKNTEEWKDKPTIIKEKLVESLENYMRLTNLTPFVSKLSKDMQSKTLTEIWDKYFSSQQINAFDFSTPFAMDFFKLFSSGKLIDADIFSIIGTEKTELIPKIAEQTLEKAVNRNEMLRLMVYLKSLKRADSENSFDCYIVDAHELKDFLEIIKSHPSILEKQRIQILVRSDVHYTSLDMQITNDEKSCLVMDAAMDERFMQIIGDLNQNGYGPIYVAGIPEERRQTEFKDPRIKVKECIQLDTFSCSAFGYHLLCQSSKKPDLFDFLNIHSDPLDPQEGVRYLAWKKFPADFVQTAQYPKFFLQNADWQTKPFKKEKNLVAWANEHIITVQEGSKQRETNGLINKKFSAYGRKINYLLKKMTTEDLAKIACAHPFTTYLNNHTS